MPRSRSSISGLTHLLADTVAPVYVVDEERRIVFCNAACAAWLGIEPDEITGERCDYHSVASSTPSKQLAAGLCPPPAALAGERSTTFVAREAGGITARRSAEFVPLRESTGNVLGVLVIVASNDLGDEGITAPTDPRPEDLHDQLRELRRLVRRRFQVDRLVGESAVMLQVREQVRVAIEGRANVLVFGPTGSGCEHVARTIFAASASEHEQTLLPLRCTLLDAELWSSVQDSITRSGRQGHTAPATLLLLDVDQLPSDVQNDLVRLIVTSRSALRLLATSTRSLASSVAEGQFRPELAAVISTLVIELPPLAARLPDLPLLAQSLVEEWNVIGRKQLGGFSPDATLQLLAYPWPGNLDELAQAVREACERAGGPLIQAADLPPQIGHFVQATSRAAPHEPPLVLDTFLEEIERELIERALQRAKGNKAKAARLLGVTRAPGCTAGSDNYGSNPELDPVQLAWTVKEVGRLRRNTDTRLRARRRRPAAFGGWAATASAKGGDEFSRL